MSKLVYGKNGQVRFNNEEEKVKAIDYLLSGSENIVFVKENNQNQGAWAPEYRIHIINKEGVPDSLLRNMTKGRSGIVGRINCAELIAELECRGLRY